MVDFGNVSMNIGMTGGQGMTVEKQNVLFSSWNLRFRTADVKVGKVVTQMCVSSGGK